MKVLITESRLEKLVMDYLDDIYIPDYGWSYPFVYRKDVKQYGDLVFFINDQDSYVYYGCNAGSENDRLFASYGNLHNYKCPLLSVYPHVGERLAMMFGDIWEPIFKKWFEEHTGLEVAQLTTDYI